MSVCSLDLQTYYDPVIFSSSSETFGSSDSERLNNKLEFHCLGRLEHQIARAIQRELIQRRAANQCGDSVLVCEHPPTLTLGKRSKHEHLYRSPEEWRAAGVTVLEVERGGGPTYHGPGQLMLYPVISLRERGIGVKEFVSLGLNAISEALSGAFDLPTVATLDPAGVWVIRGRSSAVLEEGRKIATVGLRIRNGITDYGFGVNLSHDLEPYQYFAPCGLARAQITSVSRELGGESGVERFFLPQLVTALQRNFR